MDPEKITYFAETDTRNKKIKFGIKAKDRLKHVYVIGKTGMGKSTMLENMAIQDIQNGNGMAFIDPHGGTAEKLLDYVPEERIKDVLYFAPFDIEYPVSFNVMEDIGVEKRHLVLSGLMSAFMKLFGEDSFSDRMQYILQNTILALLEYPGATMLGINKMLSEKDYRNKVVANIQDPSVKSYWLKEYAGYTERFAAEAIPAIQNKIGQFTSNPLIRNIIGQEKSSFDIREVMDKSKIMIINLSKGRVGEGNANLLGSMLITKIYLAAMSRAESNEAQLKNLPNFYLHVDEFQSFANKSFADILSEARKYKLNLTIAHQYIEQMEEEVRDAVFGNVGSMISFRVGALDAELLEKEFAPTFTAEDMVNLGIYQIYLKLMIDGVSSQPFSATTMGPIPKPERSYRSEIIDMSRAQFARPRSVVEGDISAWHENRNASDGKDQKPTKDAPTVAVRQSAPNKTASPSPSPISFKAPLAKPKETFVPRSAERELKKEIEKEKKAMFQTIIEEEKQKEQSNVPETISLKDLAKGYPNKNKNPSSGHVSELRQALEQLTKKNSKEGFSGDKVETTEDVNTHQKNHQHDSNQAFNVKKEDKVEPQKPTSDQSKEKRVKNEIPKDELLNLLKVDGEE